MSIEHREDVRDRAKFNRPYSRIQCELADASLLTSNFGTFAGKLGSANFIVWLDFMSAERGEQLRHLASLVGNLGKGDICRITLNAHVRTPGGNPAAQQEKFLTSLRRDLGNLVPTNAELDDMTLARFPELLFGCVRNAAETGARRTRHVIRPLLLSVYRDGVQMITATFVVADENDKDVAADAPLASWPFLAAPDWTNVQRVAVQALSSKEVRHIDYARHEKTANEIQSELSFLTLESVAQYVRYEPYFPRFRHVP